jgi:hypothetical protein
LKRKVTQGRQERKSETLFSKNKKGKKFTLLLKRSILRMVHMETISSKAKSNNTYSLHFIEFKLQLIREKIQISCWKLKIRKSLIEDIIRNWMKLAVPKIATTLCHTKGSILILALILILDSIVILAHNFFCDSVLL